MDWKDRLVDDFRELLRKLADNGLLSPERVAAELEHVQGEVAHAREEEQWLAKAESLAERHKRGELTSDEYARAVADTWKDRIGRPYWEEHLTPSKCDECGGALRFLQPAELTEDAPGSLVCTGCKWVWSRGPKI